MNNENAVISYGIGHRAGKIEAYAEVVEYFEKKGFKSVALSVRNNFLKSCEDCKHYESARVGNCPECKARLDRAYFEPKIK